MFILIKYILNLKFIAKIGMYYSEIETIMNVAKITKRYGNRLLNYKQRLCLDTNIQNIIDLNYIGD